MFSKKKQQTIHKHALGFRINKYATIQIQKVGLVLHQEQHYIRQLLTLFW